jgi:hypothetical protein
MMVRRCCRSHFGLRQGMADYAQRAAPGADPLGSNPPYGLLLSVGQRRQNFHITAFSRIRSIMARKAAGTCRRPG